MNSSIDDNLVTPHKHHDRLKFSRASLSSISSLVKKGSGYSLTVAALLVGEWSAFVPGVRFFEFLNLKTKTIHVFTSRRERRMCIAGTAERNQAVGWVKWFCYRCSWSIFVVCSCRPTKLGRPPHFDFCHEQRNFSLRSRYQKSLFGFSMRQTKTLNFNLSNNLVTNERRLCCLPRQRLWCFPETPLSSFYALISSLCFRFIVIVLSPFNGLDRYLCGKPAAISKQCANDVTRIHLSFKFTQFNLGFNFGF